MEPILKQPETVSGLEVLCFPDAEIRKVKGGSTSYAAAGTLSVLYFKDYNRYVLQLNDWRYPLMRRLPVVSDRSGVEEIGSRTFNFPTFNGFRYELKICGYTSAGIENFDAILDYSSNFFSRGEENPMRKIEASPDDKLVRHPLKDTSTMKVIGETYKTVVEKVKVKVETLKSGTININSRKHKLNLNTIKNKNFKKSAQSKLKKSYFESNEQLTKQFWKLRSENVNNTLPRSIHDIQKTNNLMAPTFFVPKLEIEEAILNNKDLINRGNYHMWDKSAEHKGFMESLKQGLTGMKDTAKTNLAGMVGHVKDLASDRSRDPRNTDPRNITQNPPTQMKLHDPVEHYSG